MRRRERTPWVGENLLRDNARNINEDVFSALQVTDSSCIHNDNMGVFLLERLNSRGVVIENPYIGFARGSVSLKLQLYKNRLFPSLQYFWNLLRESSLLSHTRQIANLQQNKVLPAEPLKRFVNEYENAIDLIKQDKNCCVFRNGIGKTIMENSIRSQCDSSLIQDYNRKYFRKANPNHIPLSFCFAKAPQGHLMKHVPTGFVKFTLDTKL